MNEILVINPSRKTRKTKKRTVKKSTARKTKGVKTMAKRRKKRTRRASAAPIRRYRKSPIRRRRRSNPSRRRAMVRRAASSVRKTIGGMNIRQSLKDIPPTMIGMFAAKAAAKLWGSDATETDPGSWTWASYLKGAIGAFVAGFVAQNIRPGWGQKVLNGGISLMAYKVIENELVPRSEFAQKWFGAEDENYFPSEYVQTDQTGTPYLLGQGNQWYPVDERHRLMGDVLEPPGRLGDMLETPGRLGEDSYQEAYFGQDPYAKGFFG